jgi:hypothetical protein
LRREHGCGGVRRGDKKARFRVSLLLLMGDFGV